MVRCIKNAKIRTARETGFSWSKRQEGINDIVANSVEMQPVRNDTETASYNKAKKIRLYLSC